MNELIGPLGLPGALVSLAGVFFLALKIKKELSTERGKNGYGLKDALGLTQGVRDQLTDAEKAIQKNVSETRHSINANLENVIDRLAQEMGHQTAAIVAAIRERRA